MGFIRLLLSLHSGNVATSCISCNEQGGRKLDFSISFTLSEPVYQLCLDLALQKMISDHKTKGEKPDGKHNGKNSGKKNREEKGKPGKHNGNIILP